MPKMIFYLIVIAMIGTVAYVLINLGKSEEKIDAETNQSINQIEAEGSN